MIESQENRLLELYLSNIDIICEGFPDSINERRRNSVENFILTGLPDRKRENYRHSPVTELFSRDWEYYFIPTASEQQSNPMNIDGYGVNIVNGFTNGTSQWLELNDGAVASSLKVASIEMGDKVCSALFNQAKDENEPLAALNNAFMQDGAFVFVPAGVKVDKPIVLTYDYRSRDEAQMCFARTLIIVEDGAEVDIVIHHKTDSEGSFFVNYLRESVIGSGAEVRFTEFSQLNDKSTMVSNCYLSQSGRSTVSAVNVWLGGELTRYNNSIYLGGHECNNKLYALYAINGNQRCDINNFMSHDAPECRSFQQVKGVVSGSATGAFTGRVYVANDAQKTEAIQQSRNLQLSKEARIYTEPQLEIYADDVKCGHGATVGQLDDESVYYMRQRGIDESDARRLQMQGFVNEVVMNCSVESASEYIRDITDGILEHL